MITKEKSVPYKFILKDGTEYVGFILVNEPDIESIIVLLYSRIKDSKPERLNDSTSGTEWKVFFYRELESAEPLNPNELKG